MVLNLIEEMNLNRAEHREKIHVANPNIWDEGFMLLLLNTVDNSLSHNRGKSFFKHVSSLL